MHEFFRVILWCKIKYITYRLSCFPISTRAISCSVTDSWRQAYFSCSCACSCIRDSINQAGPHYVLLLTLTCFKFLKFLHSLVSSTTLFFSFCNSAYYKSKWHYMTCSVYLSLSLVVISSIVSQYWGLTLQCYGPAGPLVVYYQSHDRFSLSLWRTNGPPAVWEKWERTKLMHNIIIMLTCSPAACSQWITVIL